MDETPNLNLPYIMAAQAQKHVTHNEAIRSLDVLVQLKVEDRDLATPPASPADGSAYIVGASPTDDWVGHAGEIAAYQDGAWLFYAPNEGWVAWIADEDAAVVWNGAGWVSFGGGGGGSVNPTPLVGVNATADATDRLKVSSPNVLFDHEGSDHRLKINKNITSDNASVLFQTGYSGRAEFGTTGVDDFHMKVSSDGSTWRDGVVIDKDDGRVRFPNGITDQFGSLDAMVPVPVSGATGVGSIWRMDVSRSPHPRTAAISSVSGDLITLTTNTANQFYNDAFMNGVSMVRIWNTSKSPDESAWVEASPAANQLRVHDSSMISGWAAGETIQIGDTAATGGFADHIPIDISPMLQSVFGSVFRHKGLLCKLGVQSAGGQATIFIAPDMGSGTGIPTRSYTTGTLGNTQTFIPGKTLSPISNSNLVFFRETLSGASSIGITLVSTNIVYV